MHTASPRPPPVNEDRVREGDLTKRGCEKRRSTVSEVGRRALMHFVRAEGEGAPFAERDEEHSHLLCDGCRPLPESDGS